MKTFATLLRIFLLFVCFGMGKPSQAQSVGQRLEDIERHLRTDAANQNLERFDHNYVFNRNDLDRVTDTYFKHVPYAENLVLAYFQLIDNQPFILAVYEEHEKPEPNSFGNVPLLGHTVFLRRMENGLPVVKSWTLMGNFRLSNLIRSTYEMVSKATPNGQLHNRMPTTFGQRLLFVATLDENGGRAGELHGALSIIPPKESPVAQLLLRLDSFCNALLEGKFGPSKDSDRIILSQ